MPPPSSSRGNRGSDDGRSGKSRSRSGGRPASQREKGGDRRSRRNQPPPEPTLWQKVVKGVTLGRVDPTPKKRPARRKSGVASGAPAKSGGEGRGKSDRKGESKRKGEGREKKPQWVEPTSPRLYVGNIDFDSTDEDLERLFSDFGTVAEASVVRHSRSGRSKGFAFVEMGGVDEARAAASKLHGVDFQGRRITVSGAKSEKPPREDIKKKGQAGSKGGAGKPSSAGQSARDEGGDRNRSEGSDPEVAPPAKSRRESGGRESRREPSGGREHRERSERGERGGGPRGRGGRGEGKGPRQREDSGRRTKPLQVETVSSPSLVVAGVDAEATDEDMTDLFEGIGTVRERKPADQAEGASTRSFRVDLAETAEAQRAVELLHGKSFMGHRLSVTGATPGGEEPLASDGGSAVEESRAGDANEPGASNELGSADAADGGEGS